MPTAILAHSLSVVRVLLDILENFVQVPSHKLILNKCNKLEYFSLAPLYCEHGLFDISLGSADRAFDSSLLLDIRNSHPLYMNITKAGLLNVLFL